MRYYKHESHVPSLHYALYQLFSYVIFRIAGFLPEGLVPPLFAGVKYLFLMMFGFAAWVRSFSESGVLIWLLVGFVICTLTYRYMGHPCFYPDSKCKLELMKEEETEVEAEEQRLEKELKESIHESLEQVKSTLESKARLEEEIEMINDTWKEKLAIVEKRTDSLEEELLSKEEENSTIKEKYEKDISMLSDSIESMKHVVEAKRSSRELASIEKAEKLERENETLRENINLLTKQRQTMEAKHIQVLQKIQVLLKQKSGLEQRLVTREALENIEKEKLKEVQKLTEKLYSALGNAKGRLTQVQSTLEIESDRSLTSTPLAVQRQQHTKFAMR